MKPEEIKLSDWSRILMGEVPPEFLIEVVLRMVLLYVILLFSMRMLGKRMASQLTRNELAALVSLAAAIGVPILAPDRGILPALIIALIVVGMSRLMAALAFRSEKFESFWQGKINTLVTDGVLNFKTMTRSRVSRDRVLAELRCSNILHLGEVQRLYMEANGKFTLIKTDRPKPGLPVIPPEDNEFLKELKQSDRTVCKMCGLPSEFKERQRHECSNCGNDDWTKAVEKPRFNREESVATRREPVHA